jgi:hypothetical protein
MRYETRDSGLGIWAKPEARVPNPGLGLARKPLSQ